MGVKRKEQRNLCFKWENGKRGQWVETAQAHGGEDGDTFVIFIIKIQDERRKIKTQTTAVNSELIG